MKALLLVLSSVFLLAGCVTTTPSTAIHQPMTVRPEARQVTAPAHGSIYNVATSRPLFEDRRARLVGDTVTIRIVENVTASQKSTSTANRTSSIDGSITAVPGLTFPGTTAENNFRIGAASKADFSGKGGTEAANTFSGTITATVAEVQPNGHLVVTGEKQIGLNHNVDVLRFTGTIDPLAILPGNVVNSSAVANVRVESKGRGPQHEAQTVGWLTRFFFNISPF